MTPRYFRLLLLCLLLGLQALAPFIHGHAAPLAEVHAGFLHLHADAPQATDGGTQHVGVGVVHEQDAHEGQILSAPARVATWPGAEPVQPRCIEARAVPPRPPRASALPPPALAPPLR